LDIVSYIATLLKYILAMGKIAAVEGSLGKAVGKTSLIDHYTRVKEIVDLIELLHTRYEGWKEFYLYRQLASGKFYFVRVGNRFEEMKMNKTFAGMLGWLDLKYPGWKRFVLVEDRYERRPYKACAVGTLLRQGAVGAGVSATNKLRLVVEMTETHMVVNEEDEATLIRYEFAKRGKSTMEIVCEDFDVESFEAIFGEAS